MCHSYYWQIVAFGSAWVWKPVAFFAAAEGELHCDGHCDQVLPARRRHRRPTSQVPLLQKHRRRSPQCIQLLERSNKTSPSRVSVSVSVSVCAWEREREGRQQRLNNQLRVVSYIRISRYQHNCMHTHTHQVMKMVVYLRDCQFLSMELYNEFAAANRLVQTPFWTIMVTCLSSLGSLCLPSPPLIFSASRDGVAFGIRWMNDPKKKKK